MELIDKDVVISGIERLKDCVPFYPTLGQKDAYSDGLMDAVEKVLDISKNKKQIIKSGIVEGDYFINFDDGTSIDLDPAMQLNLAFDVKDGEKVKVIIIKEQ